MEESKQRRVEELPDPATVRDTDIFISYAAVDDQPRGDEGEGWVSQFQRNLGVRARQLSGEPVKIWRYPGSAETAETEPLLGKVSKTKTLISIVSPAFVKSTGCLQQVEAFWKSAERDSHFRLDSGSRIFKVVKQPVPLGEFPSMLAELFSALLDFEFYDVDPETSRVREYDDACHERGIQRYHERVYDLAQEICEVLGAIRQSRDGEISPASATGATIYLATTTSDVEPQRDRLRRELLARGHTVLPDRPLPPVEEDLVNAVEGFLERCEFSVHTVGGLSSVVPEGTDRSILDVQNGLAGEHSGRRGLARLIWIPRGLNVRDPRQASWLDVLRTDPHQRRGSEVMEDRYDNVKALILRRLAEQAERARNPKRERPPRVYLICDRRDEAAIEALEDFFFEHGVEVSRPAFEASEAEAAQVQLDDLRHCDAALIYYGAAGRPWVESHVRDLAKATGYRETGAITVQAIYVAPPFDRRKEHVESLSVEVLRQGDDFEPRVLEPLVVRILETRTDA